MGALAGCWAGGRRPQSGVRSPPERHSVCRLAAAPRDSRASRRAALCLCAGYRHSFSRPRRGGAGQPCSLPSSASVPCGLVPSSPRCRPPTRSAPPRLTADRTLLRAPTVGLGSQAARPTHFPLRVLRVSGCTPTPHSEPQSPRPVRWALCWLPSRVGPEGVPEGGAAPGGTASGGWDVPVC